MTAFVAADTKLPEGVKRQTCTDHCSTCGRHFHGTGAFDAHRQQGECVEPAEAVNSKGAPLLQEWTTDGWCSLTPGCWEEGRKLRYAYPVTVWQRYGSNWAGPEQEQLL